MWIVLRLWSLGGVARVLVGQRTDFLRKCMYVLSRVQALAGRLQIDALCHHVSSGSATWAIVGGRDFAVQDVKKLANRTLSEGQHHAKVWCWERWLVFGFLQLPLQDHHVCLICKPRVEGKCCCPSCGTGYRTVLS
jgi:hypothetical protein